MTDKELQRKLNALADLANELDAEAKRRYGQAGMLFFEAGGNFHIMSGDAEPVPGRLSERQAFIQLSSNNCAMGAGAW